MPAGRKRIDPMVRAADGRRHYDKISGKDPTRHYVLTNPMDEECGTSAYRSAGYDVETVRPGGPSSVASRNAQPGGTVAQGGQILMSCPMEEYDARWTEGQELAGHLEARILKDGGIEDGLRGRGFSVTASVSGRVGAEE